ADEPGVQVAHWERDLGSLEPRALPPHKRRREALHDPAHPGFGEPLEHRRTPLPRRRVAPRMEEQPDHFATARETTSYTKRTPKVTSSRLTRSSFPCTPRDPVWVSGNGASP